MPVNPSELRVHPAEGRDDCLFSYDLAIVGGGIVGLTLACALQQSGLSVAVIEAQLPEQAAARQRAYALSLMSGKIFQDMGLWDAIAPHITHFQRVQLSDADCRNVVSFDPQDADADAVYYGAEHPVLMRALQVAIQKIPTLDYWYATQLTEVVYQTDAVQLQVEYAGQAYQFRTPLLVGADGARSHIREQAGIRTVGWQYWQACMTTVLQPAKSHQNTAYEKFWPSGPFAILPIPGNRCQIVWTAPHEEAKALLSLSRSQFMSELKRRYGDQMGELTMLSDPLMFPVRLMQSRQYVKPRLALVGDAAHCCHPVGGQGLNMGIRDAAALAQVLQQAQGSDLGSLAVLNRYERWRRPENWLILGLTDLLNRTFSNTLAPVQWLRRTGLWLLAQIPFLKRLMLRLMTGFFGKPPQMPSPTPLVHPTERPLALALKAESALKTD
jgi:2-octaprenyl-6-methoxyphenol hydroxylase